MRKIFLREPDLGDVFIKLIVSHPPVVEIIARHWRVVGKTDFSQAKFDGYVSEWRAYEGLDDQWYYQATLRVLFLMTAGGYLPAEY